MHTEFSTAEASPLIDPGEVSAKNSKMFRHFNRNDWNDCRGGFFLFHFGH